MLIIFCAVLAALLLVLEAEARLGCHGRLAGRYAIYDLLADRACEDPPLDALHFFCLFF